MESSDNIGIIGKNQIDRNHACTCIWQSLIFLVLKCSEIDHPHLFFTESFWGTCPNFPDDVSDVIADFSKKKR